MGTVVNIDICHQPTAGAPVGLVWVVIFLYFWVRSHFGMVLPLVNVVCKLPVLWYCFGWALAKGILEGVGSQENMEVGCILPTRSLMVSCGKGPEKV